MAVSCTPLLMIPTHNYVSLPLQLSHSKPLLPLLLLLRPRLPHLLMRKPCA